MSGSVVFLAVMRESGFAASMSDVWRERGSEFMAPFTATPRCPEIIITDSLLVGEDESNGLMKEEDFENAGNGKCRYGFF